MATAPYVRNACAMLFRRDLARSGSALACNILAGRPKGTHMAVVPRRANARQPPPPPARPKRAGRGSLGRAWDRGALAFACMRPHTHCMLPHARTARSHSTRHGGADLVHDMAQAAPPRTLPKCMQLSHSYNLLLVLTTTYLVYFTVSKEGRVSFFCRAQ